MTQKATALQHGCGKRSLAALALSALALLAGCASDGAADATAPTPAQQGRMLAQRECARCHAIGELGGSPRADAPPLRDVLGDVGSARIRTAFQEGMMVGHRDMPIYELSEAETDALLAYLTQIQDWSGPRPEPGRTIAP